MGVHVGSSWRLHRDQVVDKWVDATGCIGPFYLKVTIFIVLDPRDILAFSLLLSPINRTLEGWGS
jgi:hypothetical protein